MDIRSNPQRYPNPELMTQQEVDALTKLYLALGFDLKQMADQWQRNMTITKIPSGFPIHHDKFQVYLIELWIFLLKVLSLNTNLGMEDLWLKQSIYLKEALKHLKRNAKILNG